MGTRGEKMYRKIKLLRERNNLSLQELADKTGIAKSTLQRYETGTTKKIPQSAIFKMENVFEEKITDDDLSEKDKRDISLMLKNCLLKLESEALMFDGEIIDTETRELLKASIENSIRMAKIISKSKS